LTSAVERNLSLSPTHFAGFAVSIFTLANLAQGVTAIAKTLIGIIIEELIRVVELRVHLDDKRMI
jgi:hypothetical protein